jgi:flagellar hook-associated protein 3 FlgL
MRVPTLNLSESLIGRIQQLNTRQADLQQQVATGQRIFQPEDDPAAVGRLLNLGAEGTRLAQFQRNINGALDLASSSYSALDQFAKLSERTQELATLAASGPNAESARAYAAELDQLVEQAVQIGNTRFRGDYLFAGTALNSAPYTPTRDAQGRVTSVAYAGNSATAPIALSETAALAPRPTGATNTALATFMNQLVALRDSVAAADTTAVAAQRSGLEGAEQTIIEAIGENGALQSRVRIVQEQQQARSADLTRLVSGEADVDMAATIVRLQESSNAYEAALATTTRVLQMSLLDYLR